MSNLISSFLFAFLHFFLLIHSKPLAPALYVFGDSLFDSGNNNHLPTLAKANYPPYAELLELPYPPPYLSINESITLSGLNYASSACGILPETGSQLGKCLSLGQQIDFFQSTVESKLPSHFKSSKELSNYLAKSIFMLTMGSNDYIQSYFEPTLFSTSQDYDPQTYAQLLIDALSKHLERLYELGARKLIMLEIPPLGCIPHYTRRYELTGKCHEETNQIVSFFNSRLHPMLKNLTSTLRGGPCPNPNAQFFWDGYHNTETGNSIAASLCFNDPEFCSPISIRELLQI
ncbi:GDSL lipase/esterase - like 10 [Theobroma cacao]|nr:GDSL lipase/esterase - like 10 [Theobroma cacao]